MTVLWNLSTSTVNVHLGHSLSPALAVLLYYITAVSFFNLWPSSTLILIIPRFQKYMYTKLGPCLVSLLMEILYNYDIMLDPRSALPVFFWEGGPGDRMRLYFMGRIY
jgi:hypothetical protein